MSQDTKQRAKKPGTSLITGGVVTLALGVVFLVINLTNPFTQYVAGVGMVTTRTPSPGAITLLIVGLILAAFGFCRRLLAAVENR